MIFPSNRSQLSRTWEALHTAVFSWFSALKCTNTVMFLVYLRRKFLFLRLFLSQRLNYEKFICALNSFIFYVRSNTFTCEIYRSRGCFVRVHIRKRLRIALSRRWNPRHRRFVFPHTSWASIYPNWKKVPKNKFIKRFTVECTMVTATAAVTAYVYLYNYHTVHVNNFSV